MGEMEWIVGGSWHKRDDCSSKSGILCGSLPPRKRLLAGLKQNGLPFPDTNLLSSALLQNISNNINVRNVNSSSAPARGEASLDQDVNLVLVKDDAKRLGCDCDEIIKHNCGNLIPRSCNSCTDVQMKSALCFYCLKVCKDPSQLSDSAIWLSCRSCERFIHYKCELRFSPGLTVDSATYVCFVCRHSKIHQENGVSGRKEKSYFDKGTGTGSADGSCSSTISFEMFSSSTKKQRRPRKRRRKPIAFRVENIVQSPSKAEIFHSQDHPEQGITSPSDLHEEYEVLAAKTAAMLAAKMALAARARASAKAVAALKAAAVAKAALETAALAARGAEICRRSTSTEASWEVSFVSRSDEIAVNSNGDMDVEKNNILSSQSNASFHDEELARLLHRAINSSPRISRSITPVRKKAREGAGSELTAETFTTSTQAASMPALDLCNQQATIMSIATTLIENEQPHSIKTKVDDGHVPLNTKNSSPLPFTLPAEDSSPQAIQSKVGNNSSSMVCVDYTRNLSNDNREHCTLSAVPGKCSISRPEWEAAAAVETKIVNFDKDLQKIDNADKINLKISVDMPATLRSADSEIKEAITTQPAMPENAACKNKCKHTDTIPSSLKALPSANLVERKEVKRSKGYSSLGDLNKNMSLYRTTPNGISLPAVHSNLPIEIACFHQANRSRPKREAKNCSADGNFMESSPKKEDEHSFRNIAAHLNFEKAIVKLDLSHKTSRHGLTEAGSKFGVSEVEPAKLRCESFSKVKSHVRKTLSAVPVPLDFVHTPAVSTISSGHHH